VIWLDAVPFRPADHIGEHLPMPWGPNHKWPWEWGCFRLGLCVDFVHEYRIQIAGDNTMQRLGYQMDVAMDE